MKKLRKFLVVSVMVLSIIAMSGLTFNPVNAAAQAGDLIKMDGLSSVYYLGNDGKRYVFPSESVYFSWYNDFSGVVTIPASELQSYPLGANVTMRPGTKLVKITTDPKVYAVGPNGTLHWVQSEADAIALYGANWASKVVDVADAFFTNYTIGTALTSGTYPAGTLLKNANNASIYYFDGTNYRMISSESAFMANRFNYDNVVTTTMTLTASGNAINGMEDFSKPSGATTGSVVTGSGLSLALSSMTPAATSIPKNAVRIPFTKVNLTAASDGNVSLNSITVTRTGLSSYSDVDKVWAEYNGQVVASKKSMNSNNEAILTFSPAFVVSAGQTITLDLLASLTGTGSGNIGLAVTSASAVSATAASVTGAFPINGNIMSLISYDVTKLAVIQQATSSTAVKVGDENVDLGRFQLDFNTSNGTARKDVSVRSIMLKNNGVEDLSTSAMNLYLEHAGNKVTSSYNVDGRFVTFQFNDGFELLKDDGSKILYIKGDIISKENTATSSYKFELNKSTDLVAYEKSTGFGTQVFSSVGGSVLADALLISEREIQAGAVSVSKKAASPSATTIIKGSDNVVLLANIRADEAINADGLKLWYGSDTHATTTDQFENVRVYLNGVLLDSFDPSVSTTTALSQNIDSNLTLKKGDNELKVEVKAKSNASSGAVFYAKLDGSDMFASMNPEYVVSGNTIATPGGSATGANFTVAGASLTTVRNDGYATDKVIVRGSMDVSLGKFVVKATNDEVKITSVNLGGNTGAATQTLASSISDMKLYVDGSQVGSTIDFGTSGANFSSLNITIAKDSTKSFELFGSFDSAAVADSYFKTVMTINAQDSRGASIGSGNTATTTQFQIKEQGTLNIERGGNSPVEGILATKSDEQEVAQFKFTAINDEANLTEINVANVNGDEADARIASLRLYDGSTLVDEFVPVTGAGKFTINNSVIVPANQSKTLSVRVVLNNIENDATATNKNLQVRITSAKFKSSAGNENTSTFTNIDAYSFRIRKTVPTIAYQALSDTLLNAGNKTIAKFTVTADANADVTVGEFTLQVSTTTNATITALTTNGLKVNGSNKAATSTLTGTNLLVELENPEIVAAGTTKTFEVMATVTVSGFGSESVTAKIAEHTAYDPDTTLANVNGNFIWSDGASINTYTWDNGHNVVGLDTDTWVLSKN